MGALAAAIDRFTTPRARLWVGEW
eukprot:COSAG06_NODE_24574_length_658_cov_3.064401_1_plen_23_part_10